MYPRPAIAWGARAWGTSARLGSLCGREHARGWVGVDTTKKPGVNLQNVACFRWELLEAKKKIYFEVIVIEL